MLILRSASGGKNVLNFKKLNKTMRELIKNYGKKRALDYVEAIIRYWPIVILTTGRAGETMVLNETTPTHSLVQQAVAKFMAYTEEEMDDLIDEINVRERKKQKAKRGYC